MKNTFSVWVIVILHTFIFAFLTPTMIEGSNSATPGSTGGQQQQLPPPAAVNAAANAAEEVFPLLYFAFVNLRKA